MDDTKQGTTGYQKLNQRESIPACNSFEYAEGKCQKDSVTEKWNVPSMDETNHGTTGYRRLAQQDSVPACTSYECKKKSAVAPYDLPSDNGTDGW